MKYPSHSELLELSEAERVQLLEDVWNTLEPETLPLSEADREELERRLDAWQRDPVGGDPWPVVRQRIAKSK